MPTSDTSNRHGLTGAFLAQIAHYNASAAGTRDVNDPAPTLMAQPARGDQALVQAAVFPMDYNCKSGGEAGMADPLRTLTQIEGEALAAPTCASLPRPLLRAQFGKYADGYVLHGTKEVKVAGIGNSVCPEVEEALVRANYQPILVAA